MKEGGSEGGVKEARRGERKKVGKARRRMEEEEEDNQTLLGYKKCRQ